MSLTTLFRKASNLLGFVIPEATKPPPLDGEIIYCKNNVCVHPPTPLTLEEEHYPGYLTLRSLLNKKNEPTLILTWIPNSTLKHNNHSLQNSPVNSVEVTVSQSLSNSGEKCPNQSKIDSYDSKLKADVTLNHNGNCKVTAQEGLSTLANHELSAISQTLNQTQAAVISNDSDTLHLDEMEMQNNELSVDHSSKQFNVGVNVNVLNATKDTNLQQDLRHQIKCTINSDGDEPFSSDSDSLTTEEQLALLLNRSKLNGSKMERRSSNRSVTVEMDGDQLLVVAEDSADPAKHPMELNINPDNECEANFAVDPLSPEYIISPTSAQATFNPEQCEQIIESMKTVALYKKSSDTCETNVHDFLASSSGCGSLQNKSPLSAPSPKDMTSHLTITRQLTMSSSTTSGPDSCPPSPYSSLTGSEASSPCWSSPKHTLSVEDKSSSPELYHNMTFPHNALIYHRSKHQSNDSRTTTCGVFSVDLAHMRSLRLFYSDRDCTRGQVVIASHQGQYKILHFHHTGLDRLAKIFEEWNLFAQSKVKPGNSTYKHFLIVRPQLTDDQCHPEENVYGPVTDIMWKSHLNDCGQVEDTYQLQKAIFFGGVQPSIRHHLWPFLLNYYSFKSTFNDREQIRNERYIDYHNIQKVSKNMTSEEKELFWRRIQCIVEKDVVRTDRSHPYYKGDNNPNIITLKNILLNYAVAHPRLGYTQGMSDLLAPVLAEVKSESDAYWCFEGLMQKTLFCSPKDHDMDQQLKYLRELIRLMIPAFFAHLLTLGNDGMELLFCHRWILLCFKREFSELDTLRMWEACWSLYQTDYFHLFICLAIISIYGDDIVEQELPADDILLHFSSLAMHMNGELVLRKARGLLHQYRSLRTIPCTLYSLCSFSGTIIWDSGSTPIVECMGHAEGDSCSYFSGARVSESGSHQ